MQVEGEKVSSGHSNLRVRTEPTKKSYAHACSSNIMECDTSAGFMMLCHFTSYSFFHPQKPKSVCLKAAVVLGLGFFLPVALMCQGVERRYKTARYKNSVRSRPNLLIRRMYVFVKLSGLSEFSEFLLSANCRRPTPNSCSKQDQSAPLSATS